MAIHFQKHIAPDTKFPFASDQNGNAIFLNNPDRPMYYVITDDQAKDYFRQCGLDPDAVVVHEYKECDPEKPAILIQVPLR